MPGGGAALRVIEHSAVTKILPTIAVEKYRKKIAIQQVVLINAFDELIG